MMTNGRGRTGTGFASSSDDEEEEKKEEKEEEDCRVVVNTHPPTDCGHCVLIYYKRRRNSRSSSLRCCFFVCKMQRLAPLPPGLLYSLLQLQLLGDAARALLDASRRIALRRSRLDERVKSAAAVHFISFLLFSIHRAVCQVRTHTTDNRQTETDSSSSSSSSEKKRKETTRAETTRRRRRRRS